MQQALIGETVDSATELGRERRQSEALFAHLARLSGTFSHDFNNLLSIMMLNVEQLQNSMSLSERNRRRVDILAETIRRGSDMSQSLMTISQQRHDSRLPLRIDRLLIDNRALFATIVGDGVSFVMELGADGVVVDVSKVGLISSLVNLLVNAREAAQDGGQIVLRTRIACAEETELLLGSKSNRAPYLVVEVVDNGRGLPDCPELRLMEFSHSATRLVIGLGLPAVHDFAVEMDGFATMRSVASERTEIAVWLPIPMNHQILLDRAEGHPTTVAPVMSASIVIVEDEPLALEALAEFLEIEGHQVTVADSAEEAQDLIGVGRCDILLTDIVMPGKSGIELAAWVGETRPEIAIILMSGFVPDSSALRPEWRFLRKPLRQDVLREMISSTWQGMAPRQ